MPADAERLDTLFAPWNRTDEPGKDGEVIYRRGFGAANAGGAVAKCWTPDKATR